MRVHFAKHALGECRARALRFAVFHVFHVFRPAKSGSKPCLSRLLGWNTFPLRHMFHVFRALVGERDGIHAPPRKIREPHGYRMGLPLAAKHVRCRKVASSLLGVQPRSRPKFDPRGRKDQPFASAVAVVAVEPRAVVHLAKVRLSSPA